MDINYLFQRQQVERRLARAATSAIARKIHEQLADGYERQIEEVTQGRVMFVAGRAERARAD
jgi:hypothetical protein